MNPAAMATAQRMSGLQKVAALMVTIGRDSASRVMELLSEAEREDVTRAILELEAIDFDTQQLILAEFINDAEAHSYAVAGSVDYARDLLLKFHGPDADRILERLLAASAQAPFMSLRNRDPEQLAQVLNGESPQTIAVVLSYLPSGHAAEVLLKISPTKQAETALRMARIENPAPEFLASVEESLRQQLGQAVQMEKHQRRGGVKDLAAILNASDRQTERTILGALSDEAPDVAEQVRALMFVFEDLVRLSVEDLEKVLQGTSPTDLALALKGVKGGLKDKILDALSERMRNAVEQELQVMRPRRSSEVEAAQSEIVNRARDLDEKQEIIISRGGGGDMVV